MRKTGPICKNTLSKIHFGKIHFGNWNLKTVGHSFESATVNDQPCQTWIIIRGQNE